ncbi:LysR family transcriptional regulator [Sinorhizobium americanum]|uniref:LysR family transcriptional regulator n=1 Tax=Sinorhizobium americanum TaxID=194963 RepID=A0A1L3LXE9_9HYPH|nr:LysR substrate-binding domain-containing protein [Sinorhizobium americanum]APG94726.1 LysR family transcriptional regulator [Sinorhizobium americanum]OAP48758.1 LysR family transcriptional regulator [Sinorhizobium americanum]
MRDLEAGLLRAFVATAECGSVSAAAVRLARTQAAVSMQLRRLEDDLGAKLLMRGPRGMGLTEAGNVLLPYAQKILGLSASARRALSGRALHGPIRFGMTEDIAVGSLPKALQRFAASYPDVALDLAVADSTALSQKLSLGLIDVAIGDPSEISAEPAHTWRMPLRWVAARGFVVPDKEPLPLITFDGNCTWDRRMIGALNAIARPWRTVLTSASLSSIQSAIEAGLGVAVLLDVGIRHDTMKVLNGADGMPPAPLVEFGLFVAEGKDLSSGAIGALWEFVADELQASSDRRMPAL